LFSAPLSRAMPSSEPSAHADVRSDDHYKVLGLDRAASEADIAKAYKRLALKHHPDKHPDPEAKARAEETFKRISEAYSVLSDAEKRKAYDLFGKDGPQAGGAASPGPGFSGFAGGGDGGNLSREQADEIFRTLFGGSVPAGSAGSGGLGRSSFVFTSNGHNFGGAAPMDVDSDVGMGGGFLPMDMDSLFAGAFGAGFGAPSRRQSFVPPYALPSGTAVVIRDLAGAAKHNGKSGRVLNFDGGRTRYDVSIEGGHTLSVKPQHLTQQCEVEVAGLTAKPELNGKVGSIVSYDSKTGRYMVLLQSPPTAIALQRKNCILHEGARGVLAGLAKGCYNGQMVRIVGVDRAAGRYAVQCQSGEDIKVRYEKVIC